jgi:hypothetical protein
MKQINHTQKIGHSRYAAKLGIQALAVTVLQSDPEADPPPTRQPTAPCTSSRSANHMVNGPLPATSTQIRFHMSQRRISSRTDLATSRLPPDAAISTTMALQSFLLHDAAHRLMDRGAIWNSRRNFRLVTSTLRFLDHHVVFVSTKPATGPAGLEPGAAPLETADLVENLETMC